MTAPIKTCDYCCAVGVMPTFMNGETVCYDCLASLLKTMREAWREIVSLRAKIERMERQEPVAWCATDETGTVVEALGMNQSRRFDTALYLAPGAQPEPIIPEGWKPVPIEVIYLYSIMCAAFVPMTPQQEEIALQLDLAKRAMLAVAPEAKP